MTLTAHDSPRPVLRAAPQRDLSAWIDATSEPDALTLRDPLDPARRIPYADLFEPTALAALGERFHAFLAEHAPDASARLGRYLSDGEALGPTAVSEALVGAAPWLSRFLAALFGVEAEADQQRAAVGARTPLWTFKRDFAKKRLFKAGAGSAFTGTREAARELATAALTCLGAERGLLGRGDDAEELSLATAGARLVALDETARRASKAGGASLSAEDLETAHALERALVPLGAPCPERGEAASDPPSAADVARLTAFALDALEAWLAARRADHADGAHAWQSLRAPREVRPTELVQLRRPDASLPERFVGPESHRRQRDGFALTDPRPAARVIDAEIDYCLLCHDRDKDSCSKGLRENKPGPDGTRAIKANALGVPLEGCPLEEKIGEMHAMRAEGDALAALAIITIDNPMLPGTGHRICNDCMKACVFQKQEPVNIPAVETSVLTDVLALPWGVEIYGLLTRWNPLSRARPHARPYRGKNVLVVGLGPAGYTLAHHLACEGFGVVAVEGLKVEPLPVELTGDATRPPRPVRDFAALTVGLDERVVLGFGGVSEYGITVRWDKNFLTLLYLTIARSRNVRIHGGIRFGGTLDLEDAWRLGFDHVALAAGAGKPTMAGVKNDAARGMRAASDFLMALQLSGAAKPSGLANLQVRLPALVIGGGLTAIDTATELLAYYVVQIERTDAHLAALIAERGEDAVMGRFDEEEREVLAEQRAHAAELRAERARAEAEGRVPDVQALVRRWGGVNLVYRKRLVDSPAYRLNHEEVEKSLEEGVQYVECLSPTEALLDARGAVRAMRFERQALDGERWRSTGEHVELAARTVCVAAGTSPNVTYEREHPGSFAFDRRGKFFQTHRAVRDAEGLRLEPCAPHEGFFTSHLREGRTVSFYGDNHPHYAGSVVRAMASAKDGHAHVAALFPTTDGASADVAARDALFARVDDALVATVHAVSRLTPTIVEVVVRAPLAARKFEPGQFYRFQDFEQDAPWADGTRLAMEGLALTGAWVDRDAGLLSLIALEMGASSRLLSALRPGARVVVMGPTGAPTEVPPRETVLLAGGGLGNAVLFSISRALRERDARVVYFAGYKRGEDCFKQDEIERATDQVIWCTDAGVELAPRRPQDRHVRGNIVQAMVAYARGELGGELVPMRAFQRIIAIGSDRMMNAVREARHGVLAPYLDPTHVAIGSINSPMQCMMKEICAQCLQKHRDPETGKETLVFTCMNQDQPLDRVDFAHLGARLRQNSAQEKLADAWLEHLLARTPLPRV